MMRPINAKKLQPGTNWQLIRYNKIPSEAGYTITYVPTITYSFTACSFTLQQTETIQAKAIEKFLTTMGWRRTSTQAFVHGPMELGGIGLPHIFNIKGDKNDDIDQSLQRKIGVGSILHSQHKLGAINFWERKLNLMGYRTYIIHTKQLDS